MFSAAGDSWRITVDTSEPILIALYLREVCGLGPAGMPAVSASEPSVRRSDSAQLLQHFGGADMFRFEWEEWWSQLLGTFPGKAPAITPPDFEGFAGNPALQHVLRAHYGLAEEWAAERAYAYRKRAKAREETGSYQLLETLVHERELESGSDVKNFDLDLIELPLESARAWFVEPHTVLLSDTLIEQENQFRSYLRPVMQFLA